MRNIWLVKDLDPDPVVTEWWLLCLQICAFDMVRL